MTPAYRYDRWAEFIAGCGTFDAEIAKGTFTVAELEEEEQSVERLVVHLM